MHACNDLIFIFILIVCFLCPTILRHLRHAFSERHLRYKTCYTLKSVLAKLRVGTTEKEARRYIPGQFDWNIVLRGFLSKTRSVPLLSVISERLILAS